MQPLYSASPVPFVAELVTRGALVNIGILMHLLTSIPRRAGGLLFPSQYLWNDIADTIFDGVGQEGFKSRTNTFLLA